MGRLGFVGALLLTGCAPETEGAPERSAAARVTAAAPAEPPTAHVPHAPARPEFLGRDSICKRATVRLEAGCATEWTQACDRALMAASYAAPNSVPATGSCYYHDRNGCPDCACDYYVKVNKQGFDGGTGCLGTPEDVLSTLYGECAAQRCEPRGQ